MPSAFTSRAAAVLTKAAAAAAAVLVVCAFGAGTASAEEAQPSPLHAPVASLQLESERAAARADVAGLEVQIAGASGQGVTVSAEAPALEPVLGTAVEPVLEPVIVAAERVHVSLVEVAVSTAPEVSGTVDVQVPGPAAGLQAVEPAEPLLVGADPVPPVADAAAEMAPVGASPPPAPAANGQLSEAPAEQPDSPQPAHQASQLDPVTIDSTADSTAASTSHTDNSAAQSGRSPASAAAQVPAGCSTMRTAASTAELLPADRNTGPDARRAGLAAGVELISGSPSQHPGSIPPFSPD